MAVTSVQILGLENVMQAFENKGAVKWSCWQGRTMNEYYDGNDPEESAEKLRGWLQMISGYSKAIYTLKFYGDDVENIRSNTPDSGGFNFRLYDDESEVYPSRRVSGVAMGYGGSGALAGCLEKLTERLEGIERKIAGPLPEKEPEPELWEKLLDNPLIVAGCAKILGIDPELFKAAQVAGPVGSLENSIEILQRHDPELESHLHKLATLAQNNPQQFKMLVGMLDKM